MGWFDEQIKQRKQSDDQLFEEAFDHGDNVVLSYKRHFKVDLSEFGLPVGSEVLVPEASCDLNVSVKARKHKKLLVELRRLRKSVEFTVMNSAGNKIVTRALGGGSY